MMLIEETGKTEEEPPAKVNEFNDDPKMADQLQLPTSNEIKDGTVVAKIQGESSPKSSTKGPSRTNNRKRSC